MPRVPTLQIILARENECDDIIRIKPHEENPNLFTVKYEDEDSGHTYYFEDSWKEVVAYLAQIFAVLPLDQKPYTGVQFNLPAYPCIWIKTRQTACPCVMEPIWTMLNSVAQGWPALRGSSDE